MNSKRPTRRKMDERMNLVLPSDLKQALFEIAAASGRTASQVARDGIAGAVMNPWPSLPRTPASSTRLMTW